METHEFTTTVYYIVLRKRERFTVIVPKRGRNWWQPPRPWTIEVIQVHDGYITLQGNTRPNGGGLRDFPWSFGSIEDLPSLPEGVSAEIERCLKLHRTKSQLTGTRLPRT